jgi:hypothetical protein
MTKKNAVTNAMGIPYPTTEEEMKATSLQRKAEVMSLKELARKVANTPDRDVEEAAGKYLGSGLYVPPIRTNRHIKTFKPYIPIQPLQVKLINGHLETSLTKAVRDAVNEYKRASSKFPPFNSYHEGYAILNEELDELWDEVKKKDAPEVPEIIVVPPNDFFFKGFGSTTGYRDKKRLREEAVQVAAMALRFLVDLCSETS